MPVALIGEQPVIASSSGICTNAATSPPTQVQSKRTRFLDVFPRLRQELVSYLAACEMPKEALDWFEGNLNHNVPHGKLYRGLSVIDTLEILKDRPLTNDEYFKAATLGWCIELVNASFSIFVVSLPLSCCKASGNVSCHR
jgi:hypothetical protein